MMISSFAKIAIYAKLWKSSNSYGENTQKNLLADFYSFFDGFICMLKNLPF